MRTKPRQARAGRVLLAFALILSAREFSSCGKGLGPVDAEIASIERWFARNVSNGIYGRLRDVEVGPDGHLYVLTSNHDGRVELRPNDDKILRLKFELPE